MTSNGIANTLLVSTVQAGRAKWAKQVSVVRDVDVAGWGTVRCMQWWCCGFVFDDVDNFNQLSFLLGCRDVPQY